MAKENDSNSAAQDDAPETLETDALDAAAAGVKFSDKFSVEPATLWSRAKDGSKTGKVETTWKIEEGEK